MESQLAKITDFLRNQQRPVNNVKQTFKPEIIKNAVKIEPEEVQIINEPEESYNPDEYEEVEVTDDEN